MVQLHYQTLSFLVQEGHLAVSLLKLFQVSIPLQEVQAIAPFTVVSSGTLEFGHDSLKRVETRFSFLLEKYFEQLHNKLTGNSVTYIHRHSGIPLIGNVAFGIAYRGSSIIEIKPVTSCNLDCIYCSISEGLSSKKHDFVVEKDYLLEELQKLVHFVNEPVEIHIGVQGEPFLYDDLMGLISEVQEMNLVQAISIDTNGTLLNREKIDLLAKNNKLQLNLSLDALDPAKAKEMAGVKNYNLEHVKSVISYASEKLKVIVAPVLTDGYNNREMEKIIEWIKVLPRPPVLGLQNFLSYKTGRNPTKEISWDKFYGLLAELEQQHGLKLRLDKQDFNIKETKELPKPFKEGEVISAVIKCPDRFKNSVIAVAKGRNISVPGCAYVKNRRIKLRIIRDKHNIFTGKLL